MPEEKLGAVLISQIRTVPNITALTSGTFTVEGPACFIADNNTGQGSISGTGSFIYPPAAVLIGVAANPATANAPIDLLFAEADQFGDAAVFGGTGTVSNRTITGTWACNPNSPVRFGLSGTFSGTQP